MRVAFVLRRVTGRMATLSLVIAPIALCPPPPTLFASLLMTPLKCGQLAKGWYRRNRKSG